MSDHFGFGARFIATNFKSVSPNVKNMGRGLSVGKVVVWRRFRRQNWPGPLIFDMVFFDMGRSTFVQMVLAPQIKPTGMAALP